MTQDTIVVGGSVTKEGIRSDALIPAMDVAGGKTRIEMLAHGQTDRGSSELGSGSDCLLDTIDRDPTEEWTHDFEVRLGYRNRVCDSTLLATFSQN